MIYLTVLLMAAEITRRETLAFFLCLSLNICLPSLLRLSFHTVSSFSAFDLNLIQFSRLWGGIKQSLKSHIYLHIFWVGLSE